MPDAVGDVGSGEDLATGRRSLADWPPWAELLALLQRAYGADARCVLYRAPVWASATESCMLSAPLNSLGCRSCIDGIVRAWGGDLGTMYVAGGGGGGERADGDGDGERDASAAAAGGAGVGADMLPVGGKVTAAATAPRFKSSFDDERQAWLRRWAIFEVQHAAVSRAPVQTLLGAASPRGAVPPNSAYAFEAVARRPRHAREFARIKKN